MFTVEKQQLSQDLKDRGIAPKYKIIPTIDGKNVGEHVFGADFSGFDFDNVEQAINVMNNN